MISYDLIGSYPIQSNPIQSNIILVDRGHHRLAEVDSGWNKLIEVDGS